MQQMKGLHFKHTDNFNFWLNSLQHVGLPKVSTASSLLLYNTSVVIQIFYPETTDLYDRKNMPRVVYCIHALRLVV